MSRPAFALLHGGGQGSWVWDATARALEARGARVLALDVPGCGAKRGRETIAINVEELADELLADAGAAGLTDAILVGHSQAGTMLPVLWRRQAGQFRRLVYLACCAPLDGQSVLEMMGRGLHGAHRDEVGWPRDPESCGKDEMRRLTFCNDMDDAQAERLLALLDRDSWPMGVTLAAHWRYDHLAGAPSSYILCTQDEILPPEWQRRFAQRLHCGRVVEIDAGHQAMNTQPERLAELLLAEANCAA